MQTPILQCRFRCISAKRGALGWGTDLHNRNRVQSLVVAADQGSQARVAAHIGFTSHQVAAVAAGRIQVPSDPQSHAFQGKRKGLKLFYFFSWLFY